MAEGGRILRPDPAARFDALRSRHGNCLRARAIPVD